MPSRFEIDQYLNEAHGDPEKLISLSEENHEAGRGKYQ